MKRLKFLIQFIFLSQVLHSCSNVDRPTTRHVDNPNLYADSIAASKYDPINEKKVNDSLIFLCKQWQDDETDSGMNYLIKIDTIKANSKEKHFKSHFVQYTLKGNTQSIRLFNHALKKRYNEIRKDLLSSFQEGCEPDMRCEVELYNNDLKFISDKVLSIKINCFEYGGGAHGNEWCYFDNYIIEKGNVRKLDAKDLFRDDVELDSLNYIIEKDSIIIANAATLFDNAKYSYQNFGDLDYEKRKNEESYFKPMVFFSFAKNGIKFQFQYQRVGSSRSGVEETLECRGINYRLLKPYIKKDIYKLLMSE